MAWKNKLIAGGSFLVVAVLVFAAASVFFDQAVLTRRGTTFHMPINEKVVALTFDDGPSPEWTPLILRELRAAGIKATFFMLGKHVRAFPDIARRVAQEGHEIGNHTYNHSLRPFDGSRGLDREIRDCQAAIAEITGKTTTLFRPPKAWLTDADKAEIRRQGYRVVLWSLNSKDWVTFDEKYIVAYLARHIRPGDIILFHDSGGVFGIQGGNRDETVQTIRPLAEKLRAQGYRFVTVSELIRRGEKPPTEGQ